MLQLLTPRMIARSAGLYTQSGLDNKTFLKSKKLFTNVLQGGNQLTLIEMYELLERNKISTGGQLGLHILGYLAQEQLICFGARQGKQQTFALFDEWAPPMASGATTLKLDEALAQIAKRYFTSHGPATMEDFTWWSGLTEADAKAACEMVKSEFMQEVITGQTYWFSPSASIPKIDSSTTYLLPPYDEYTVAYKDRTAVLDPMFAGSGRKWNLQSNYRFKRQSNWNVETYDKKRHCYN